MKKVSLLLIIFLSIPILSTAEDNRNVILINTYQEDITGDGLLDKIELKGELFSRQSNYFHNIWAEIKTANDLTWDIQYGGGYNPSIHFIDFNHDSINDILYQSPTGRSSKIHHYKLHTFSNSEKELIPLPEQPYVTGEFINGFTTKIYISPHDKPISLSLKDRDVNYVQLGIYDQEGNVKKSPNSLIIDPIALFEPVNLSKRKGYGLKSYKQISGANHSDRLGVIETIWYYEQGKWVALQTEWKASSQ